MKIDSILWGVKLLRRDKEHRWLLHYTVASLMVSVPIAFIVAMWSSALTLTVACFVYLHQTLGHGIRLICRVLCTERAATFEYTYGYARLQELLRYANGCVLVFASFSCIMEGTHRFFEPHDVHPGFVSVTAFMLIGCTFASMFASTRNQYSGSASGLLMACGQQIYAPVTVLVSLYFPDSDVLIATALSVYAMYSTLPVLSSTSSVLLQKFPTAVKPFIDNALRAAASTDGVLEVRDEHFWTLSDGILVGTFTLRLRWDANEQNVLKEVSHRFEPILSHCTINVARDAWDPTKEAAQGQGAQPLAQPLSMAQLFPAAPPPPMVFNFPLPPPPPLPRQ